MPSTSLGTQLGQDVVYHSCLPRPWSKVCSSEIRGQEQSRRKSASMDRQDPTVRSVTVQASRVPRDVGSAGREMAQIQGCPGMGVREGEGQLRTQGRG